MLNACFYATKAISLKMSCCLQHQQTLLCQNRFVGRGQDGMGGLSLVLYREPSILSTSPCRYGMRGCILVCEFCPLSCSLFSRQKFEIDLFAKSVHLWDQIGVPFAKSGRSSNSSGLQTVPWINAVEHEIKLFCDNVPLGTWHRLRRASRELSTTDRELEKSIGGFLIKQLRPVKRNIFRVFSPPFILLVFWWIRQSCHLSV